MSEALEGPEVSLSAVCVLSAAARLLEKARQCKFTQQSDYIRNVLDIREVVWAKRRGDPTANSQLEDLAEKSRERGWFGDARIIERFLDEA